jgi:hypothetical protein
MSDFDYILGEAVRVASEFTNSAEVVADPDAVFFKYRDPEGLITTLEYPDDAELVRDEIGNYHVDIELTIPGTWLWRSYATGTGRTATEGSFTVAPSEFA